MPDKVIPKDDLGDLAKAVEIRSKSDRDFLGKVSSKGSIERDFSGSSQYDHHITGSLNTEAQRSENQGFGSEITNTVLGGIVKAVPTIVSTVANLGDLENYKSLVTGEANDYDNWLSKSMATISGKIDEETPIYGGSSEFGSLGNREWWMNTAKSTIDSGLAFYATGAGIGSALSKGAALSSRVAASGINAAKASSKLVSSFIAEANASAINNISQGLSTLTTSALLTHAEGVQLAANVFDNAYEIHYENYFKDNPLENPEDPNSQKKADHYAISHAGESAAMAHRINMTNTLLNLTSIDRMISPVGMSREAAKKATLQGVTGEWLKEGGQEYLEENINNVAENIAINDAKRDTGKDAFETALDSVFSKEGVEAGLSGFMGGVFQSGVTDAKKLLAGDFKKQNDNFNQFEENEALLNSVEGQKNLVDTISNGKFTVNAIKEINDLEVAGETVKAATARKKLLQFQALQSFQVGNGAGYEKVLNDAISNLDPAQKQETATEIKKAFKEAESIYNETLYKVEPSKQEDIYFNTVNRKNLEHEKSEYTLEKAKAKGELLKELSNYELAPNTSPAYLKEKEMKSHVENVLNTSTIYEKQKAFSELDTLRQTKNIITQYPSENDYRTAVNKLTLNQLQMNANIQEYNSIMNGTHSKQKVKEDKAVIKEKEVAKEVKKAETKLDEAKQAHKEKVAGVKKSTGVTMFGGTPINGDGSDIATDEIEVPDLSEDGLPEVPLLVKTATEYASDINNATTSTIDALQEEISNADIDDSDKADLLNMAYHKSMLLDDEVATTSDEEVLIEENFDPEPKAILEDSNTEFEIKTHINSLVNPDLSDIDNSNPPIGYQGAKIIQGWSAVAHKTLEATFDEKAGKYIRLSDTYMSNVHQDTLSSGPSIQAGTDLYIRPVGKDLKGDGSKNPVGTFNQEYGIYTAPSGGALVGHVHEIGWMTDIHIANEGKLDGNLGANLLAVTEFREKITKVFNQGAENYPVKLVHKGTGRPNYTGKYDSIEEQTGGDSRIQLATFKGGDLFIGTKPASVVLGETNNSVKLEFKASQKEALEGVTVMLVPTPAANQINGTEYMAAYIKPSVVTKDIANSIKAVIGAYLTNNETILTQFGIANSQKAVQDYINQFIYTTQYQMKDGKVQPHFFAVDTFEDRRSFKYNNPAGTEASPIHKDNINTRLGEIDLLLKERNFNLSLKTQGTKVVVLQGKKPQPVEYNSLAKQHYQTDVKAMELASTEKAYCHNPELQFSDVTTKEQVISNFTVAQTTVEGEPTTKKTLKKRTTDPLLDYNPNVAESPLPNTTYEVSGNVVVKSIYNDEVNETLETAKVQDVTNAIYSYITREFLNDGSITPNKGIENFIKYAKSQEELYKEAGEIEATPEEFIENGYLPTVTENLVRSAEWRQVIDNIKQFIPLVEEKLNQSGFNIKGKLITDYKEAIDESFDTDDAVNTKEKYDSSSFEVDPITKLTAEMKVFLNSIQSTRRDYLGNTTFEDAQNLHNKVMGILANKYLSFDEVINEMKKFTADNTISQVIDKLQSANGMVKNQFLYHFNKEYVEFITIAGDKVFDPGRDSAKNTLINKFALDIKNKLFTAQFDGSYKIAIPQEAKDLWVKIRSNIDGDIETSQVQEFLASLGVNVSLEALDYLKKNIAYEDFRNKNKFLGLWNEQFKVKGDQTKGIFGDIFGRLGSLEKQQADGKIITLEDVFNNESAFGKLATIEARFVDTPISFSVVSGTGNTYYTFTLPNMVSLKLSKLKDSLNPLRNSLAKISFTKYAQWLNQVTDKNFKLFYFDVNTFGNKKYAKAYYEMSPKQKMETRFKLFTSIMDGEGDNKLTRFLSSAKSDKTKVVGIQYNKFNVGFVNGQLDSKAIDTLISPFMAEYQRILTAQKNKTNIKGYNPYTFYLLPRLNKSELFNKQGWITESQDEARSIISKYALEFLQEQYDDTYQEFLKTGIISTKKDKDNNNVEYFTALNLAYQKFLNENITPDVSAIKYAITDYLVNQTVANYNYMALFSGDIATAYKFKHNDNIKTDGERVNETIDNYFKRLAKDVAPAQRLANTEHSTINQIFLSDLGDKYKLSKNLAQIKAILGEDAKEYAGIDISDAQEYTTTEEHLVNLFLQGKLSSVDFNNLSNKIKENSETVFTSEELVKVLQPLKPVYIQGIPEEASDMVRDVYIKTSSFPLLPQLVKGTPLDDLRRLMQDNNVHRAAFASGVKLGMQNPLDFTKIKDYTTEEVQFATASLPREGYGIQQEVPYEEDKDHILQGSQLQKLIFQGLDATFNGKKDKFSELQLELLNSSKAELFEQLGIKEINGELSIPDLTGFIEVIKEELKSRKYNPNDIDALELDSNGDLKIPLMFNSNSKRIESLILSLFTNRILKQKLPGKSYVLGSELGFEGDLGATNIVTTSSYDPKTGLKPQRLVKIVDGQDVEATAEEVEAYYKGNKSAENLVIRGSQVFLPFNFTDANGKLLNVKDFLKVVDGKKVLDTDKITPELLTMVGYRIPTQGHNSMAYIEVVGFLPKEMGDLVIASKDFTKQMGSDFDIDKLYIHRNESTQFSGRLVKEETAQNQIIDIYKEVLFDPKVFPKIIKPLGFGDLPQIAEELKEKGIENKPNSVLSPAQQDINFDTGTAGKDGIGKTSLTSVFSSLLENNGVVVEPFLIEGQAHSDISNPNSLTPGKSKLEVIAAFQSASVDNIKELLLSTVNYNTFTHNSFSTLALLGLDERFISYFLNQPVVRKYVEARRNTFSPITAKELMMPIATQFLTQEEIDNLVDNAETISMSLPDLLANLHNKMTDTASVRQQFMVALYFDRATNMGEQIANLQRRANIYTAGLSNNIADLQRKITPNAPGVKNGANLFENSPSQFGLNLGKQVFQLMTKRFFPYTTPLYMDMKSRFAKDSKEEVKMNDFIKSALITSSPIFKGEDLVKLRERLMLGEHTIAHRWDAFKRSNPNNILAKRIQPEISNSVASPSTIKYTLTSGVRTDDFDVVKTLVEMLNSPTDIDLAEDTIKYMMLNGGIQLPNNFIKLIPNNYLIVNNFKGDMEQSVSNETYIGMSLGNYQKNYIQHNPTAAKAFAPKEVKVMTQRPMTLVIAKDDIYHPEFITVEFETSPGSHKFESLLFQKNSNGQNRYTVIPKKGKGSIMEINLGNSDSLSIFPENNPYQIIPTVAPKKMVSPVSEKQPSNMIAGENGISNQRMKILGFKTSGSGRAYVESILDNIIAKGNMADSTLAKVMKAAITTIPDNITVNVAELKNSEGQYIDNVKTININSTLEGANVDRVILHELLHASLLNVIDNPGKQTDNAQRIITSLTRLFDRAKADYEKENGKIINFRSASKNGFLNLHEFISDGLTNGSFQSVLGTMPFNEEQSLGERFKKLILDLLKAVSGIELHNFYRSTSKEKGYVDSVVLGSISLLKELSGNQVLSIATPTESKIPVKGMPEEAYKEWLATGYTQWLDHETGEAVEYAAPLPVKPAPTKPKLKNGMFFGEPTQEEKDLLNGLRESPIDHNAKILQYFSEFISNGSLTVEKLEETIKKIPNFENLENKEGAILKELCK